MAEYIEQTNLRPTLTGQDIDLLVSETIEHQFKGICVPPFWVQKVRRELTHHHSTSVLVTVVGFPFGYTTTEDKLHETERALLNGADEIDMVWNLSAFKSKMSWVKTEIAKVAHLVHQHEKGLKVIIETAYLSREDIVEACKLCVDSGADFVKTSTGYAAEGATIEAIELIRAHVPDHVGVKASGGIKTREFAEALIRAGATRIGTSSGSQIVSKNT